MLDRWLGTSFWIVIGFVLGMMLAMVGLMAMVREADRERRRGVSGRDGG